MVRLVWWMIQQCIWRKSAQNCNHYQSVVCLIWGSCFLAVLYGSWTEHVFYPKNNYLSEFLQKLVGTNANYFQMFAGPKSKGTTIFISRQNLVFIRRELNFQNYQEPLSEDLKFLIIYTFFQQLCLHYTECDGGDGGTQQNAQEGTHRNGVKSFCRSILIFMNLHF